jgi:predicted MFS family arabinose efflux permease
MWTELAEGAVHAWRSRPIRVLLLLLATVSFMATPYQPLMPAFVAQAYRGGPETLGFLVAAAGFGAFAGTLYLSMRSHTDGLHRLIARAALCAGLALVAFSVTRLYPLSLLLMAATGFGILAVTVSVSMILQSTVDDRMRGRVMSLYTAAFLGVAPLGGLVAGALADRIGASATLMLGGACCALAGVALMCAGSRFGPAAAPCGGREN